MNRRRRTAVGRKLTREEKRIARYKGCMLCQWCNRWTEVDSPDAHEPGRKGLDLWLKYVDSHPMFNCRRPTCVEARRQAG